MRLKPLREWTFWERSLAIVGVAIGFAGLYLALFYEKQAALTYQILSNVDVLAVKDPSVNLEILFEGQNITKQNESLSVIVMRIVNSGQTNIKAADYDPKDPIGFRVLDGWLASNPELVASSGNYLDRVTMDPNRGTVPTDYRFQPTMIDKGDSFTIKAVVIHERAKKPSIQPLGKVSGIKSIEVTAADHVGTVSVLNLFATIFLGTFAGFAVMDLISKLLNLASKKVRVKR